MKQVGACLALGLLVLLASSQAIAVEDTGEGKSTNAPKPDEGGNSTWDQLGFGFGLSFTIDLGDNDRVKSAEIVDGLVRVTDEENDFPRVVLEGHYFFGCKDTFGHGPFVAIQPGDEEIISAAAMGYMVGFRKGKESKRSWNMGLGMVADPNVRTLGDGFEENQPPPGAETEIRYKEKTQYGLMLLFSTSWQ